MKFYILVGLIISFVAFAAASKAQKDEDMFIEEEEASGDESTPRNSMISDDEDLNTEGSGFLNEDFFRQVSTPSTYAISIATTVYSTSVYDRTDIYEEEGEFVTDVLSKLLIPSIQNISRAHSVPTGAPILAIQVQQLSILLYACSHNLPR